jgi:hypothetical protein
MAEKTVAEKLKLKPGMRAVVLHVPDGVDLGLPDGATILNDAAKADFVIEFARTQSEAERRVSALADKIGDKTIFWIGYPKGSKAKGYDISRDTIGNFAPTVGLVVNANFSIDDVWSAVRARPLRTGETPWTPQPPASV